MRLFITVLLALITAGLARPAALKTVIVSYPNDTPSSVVDKAIEEVINAGGIVTHEYSLIKGFSAKVSDSMIDTINTLTENYTPLVELDNIVTISNP
ncbi:uncharacterized protein A1O9_12642 [Exophiala aquamarina CBS 119918]|uniref:Inhibitor I9 domain-containing protein n=1 Tax=Exophiala aquamarina CBS 119918 TaxID=1182545 RepID=A0A072NV92_9EURO|nr:uncharacterized protein A1O9_12642 [Exophiala aquamarina CBS 119918]KEF51292.1 hypothetical protein A1O9_12642 [Exophiala aquamarina CBS 119918]